MQLRRVCRLSVILLLGACQSTGQPDRLREQRDTAPKPIQLKVAAHEQPAQRSGIPVGSSITGDFNGDGVLDTASLRIVKEGKFDEEPYQLAIQFSSAIISPIKASYDHEDLVLINEGDLDGQPGDELSVFAPPNHGCSYTMYTYTCKANGWKLLLEPFLIATACDPLSAEDLQKRIFREDNHIYFLNADPNDEAGSLFREKAKLKN